MTKRTLAELERRCQQLNGALAGALSWLDSAIYSRAVWSANERKNLTSNMEDRWRPLLGENLPAPDDPARPHIVGGEFQSDKYPTTPAGKVPLSVKDKTAQDLLWEYAQRRRAVDAQFAADLEYALEREGYYPPGNTPTGTSAPCKCGAIVNVESDDDGALTFAEHYSESPDYVRSPDGVCSESDKPAPAPFVLPEFATPVPPVKAGIDALIDQRTAAAHKDATAFRAREAVRTALREILWSNFPYADQLLDKLDRYAREGSDGFLDKLIDAVRTAEPENVQIREAYTNAVEAVHRAGLDRTATIAEFIGTLAKERNELRSREPFAEVWRRMQARGFQYGPDALENVKLGFELGRGTWDPGDDKPIPDAREGRSCDTVDLEIALADLTESAVEYTHLLARSALEPDDGDHTEFRAAAHALETAAYRLAVAELDTEHPCSDEDPGLFYKDAIAHLKSKDVP